MATYSLNINRTQTAAWNQGDFKHHTRRRTPSTGDAAPEVTRYSSLLMGHLVALQLVEHCSAILSSPDHRLYLGMVRKHHEDATRFLQGRLSPGEAFLAPQAGTGSKRSGNQTLPEDCIESLALLKMAEKGLCESHLKLFKDSATPGDLQTHFGLEILENLNSAVEGIDRIQRSLP